MTTVTHEDLLEKRRSGLGCEQEVEEYEKCYEKVSDESVLGLSPFSQLISRLRRQTQHLEDGEEEGEGQTISIEDGIFNGQRYEEIIHQCLESKTLFTDPEFPPDQSSLSFSGDAPSDIEWLRPHEFCDNPVFFEEGASRFDIKQGALGDCWLLAALANLTLNKSLLHRVVPKNQTFHYNYAGVFHFRFWHFGEWVDIVIDDFLPTLQGKLIYTHSSAENEFWSALTEKAYAKLYGSYEALKGGSTSEGMIDFTGGCGEQYYLKEPDCPKNLFSIVEKTFKRHSLNACSMTPDPSVFEAKTSDGLIRGHAYSITNVVKTIVQTNRMRGLIALLRLRNPWGNEAEWTGAWGDHSSEWDLIPEGEKEKLDLTFGVDGEFYMSYRDFCRQFDVLEICNLTPTPDSITSENNGAGNDTNNFSGEKGEVPSIDSEAWDMQILQGSWEEGKTAGGCRNHIETFATNPQFVVTLADSDPDDDDENLATLIVSLMQKGRRKLKPEGATMLTIGFVIYHYPDFDPDQSPTRLDTTFFRYHRSVGRSKSFVNLREVSSRFRLPPSTYVIIPSTFQPNEEGDFILRVMSERGMMTVHRDVPINYEDVDHENY